MWDAAYVLGSLSSDERREYEGTPEPVAPGADRPSPNSAACRRCWRCSTSTRSWRSTTSSRTPPLRPEVLQSVLDKVRWRRRRSRWLTSAAVGLAAALLAVGLVVAVRPETSACTTGTTEQASAQMLPI